MKTKIIIANLFLSIMFLTSCKDKVVEIEEPEIITFDVTIDVIVPKDDMLIVFYLDASDDWFSEKKTVWLGVKGSDQPQKCVFSLPEGVLPKDIRIDISSKKEQKQVTLNSVSLSYNGNNLMIQKQDIDKYFTGNEYIKFDAKTNVATLNKVGENFDPYFNTKPILYPEFQKLLIPKQQSK